MNPNCRKLACSIATALILSAASCSSVYAADENPSLDADGNTYRLQHYADWAWQGGDREKIVAAAERAISAEGQRSNPDWLDSVTAFGPGNWVWEFEKLGDQTMTEASSLLVTVAPKNCLKLRPITRSHHTPIPMNPTPQVLWIRPMTLMNSTGVNGVA